MKQRNVVITANETSQPLELNELSLETNEVQDANGLQNVPQKQILGHSLKRLKSFKKIRGVYKQKNMKNVFLNDLKTILNEYSPNSPDNKYNSELLIEILNISEEYFVYPRNTSERNEIKRTSVIELMKPYFDDNEQLLETCINNVWNKVNKSNYAKRLYSRLKNFVLKK